MQFAWPQYTDTRTVVCATGNFDAKTYDEMANNPVRDVPHNVLTASCVAAVGALWASVGIRNSVFEYNKQISAPDSILPRAYVLEVLFALHADV